jgi:Rps23 Pro-64 3,4-dihydroxylase Tpa1-like proline 4-hydroxylase
MPVWKDEDGGRLELYDAIVPTTTTEKKKKKKKK